MTGFFMLVNFLIGTYTIWYMAKTWKSNEDIPDWLVRLTSLNFYIVIVSVLYTLIASR